MTRERPRDRLNPKAVDQDVVRILALIVEVREVYGQAIDGGSWTPRQEGIGGRPSLGDSDPTHTAVTRPTQKQLRYAARRAASLIGDARERLEDAAAVLHRGLLRTDPEVLDQYLEKHRAATQDR